MSDTIKCKMPHCDTPDKCEFEMRCSHATQDVEQAIAALPEPRQTYVAWRRPVGSRKNAMPAEARCKEHINCVDRKACDAKGYCRDHVNAPKNIDCKRPSQGYGKCMNPTECGKVLKCLHTKGKRASDFYECHVATERRQCVNPTYCEAMGSCRYRNGELNVVQPWLQSLVVVDDKAPVTVQAGDAIEMSASEVKVTPPEGSGRPVQPTQRIPVIPGDDLPMSPQPQVDRSGAVPVISPVLSHESAKVISIMTGKPLAGAVQAHTDTAAERMQAALEVIDDLRARVAAGDVAGFACVGIGADDELLYWQSYTQKVSVLRIVGALQWAAISMANGDTQ